MPRLGIAKLLDAIAYVTFCWEDARISKSERIAIVEEDNTYGHMTLLDATLECKPVIAVVDLEAGEFYYVPEKAEATAC